ncbi:MAG: Ig-like domain-containing protein [Gemmatimonadota bacterium]|nr:Ig-like domain-containing protein [Gemmatimonadota bacterium]
MALALVLGGCLDPVDPTDARVASVQVTFNGANIADTINVRGTTRARAAAIASQGHDLGRTDFSFHSSDETVATVDAVGVVRALAPGTARIRATLPTGTAGEGTVIVVPSTVEYTIPVGKSPGAMAFSPDYTRLYVTIAPDSIAIVDALGYFRLSGLRLGLPGVGVAATAEAVYVTHSASDSVSVIATSTTTLTRRIFVGAGPTGATATSERAFIAARGARQIAIVEGGQAVAAIPVNGEPREVAVSRDGRRLFATVDAGGAWRLAVAIPASRDTLHSIALSSAPSAIATDLSGRRVYVLLPAESRVVAFAEGTDGRFSEAGTLAVGAGAGGVSARLIGDPLVVASGAPLTVFDGVTTTVSERITGVGSGHVAIRPDGVFAFIAAVGDNLLRVIGL